MEQTGPKSQQGKKFIENSLLSSIAVPLAIVLGGALIIFGITKMLSSERTHRDLLEEMHSKTFGNRWVAAYELSKMMSSGRIDKSEIDELVIELSKIYKTSNDPRTREFLVVAAGSQPSSQSLELLTLALGDDSANVRFHAVVALGNFDLKNYPQEASRFPVEKLISLMQRDDEGLKQAVILALAQHQFPQAREVLVQSLNSQSPSIKYAAATGLLAFKEEKALSTVDEIMKLKDESTFNESQIQSLQLNVLSVSKRHPWQRMNQIIKRCAENCSHNVVQTKAQELSIMLKL